MKESLWDHAGKEPVGLAQLLLCVQDQYFQHQDGTYKFSAAQREQRTLNFFEVSNYHLFFFFFFFFALDRLIFYIQGSYANLGA